MSIGLFLFGFIVLVGLIFYHRLPGLLGYLILVFWVCVSEYSVGSFPVLSIIFALILSPWGIAPVRQMWMSARLLKMYKKLSPTMSATEKTAIDAGTVWWDAQLFSGKPNWKQLHAFQKPTLSTEEKAFLEGPAEALCGMINDWKITHEFAAIPPEVWDYLKSNGFFAMIIKKQYGD